MDISPRLKFLMEKNKVSLPTLSKQTGISVNTIKNYLYKGQEPRAGAMTALQNYFEVTGAYLRGETDVPDGAFKWQDDELMDEVRRSLSEGMQNILALSRQADAKEQKMLSDILSELLHVMAMEKQRRAPSLDALQESFYAVTRFCDLTGSMDASEISRLQRALEDAVENFRCVLQKYAAGIHHTVALPQCITLRVSTQSASAGTGTYLGPEGFEEREVPKTPLTMRAEFGVPVSGTSMEPLFHDGDLLLVNFDEVRLGDIAVVTMDGDGYVKKIGSDALISLNKKYAPIPIDESIRISGKVIGSLPVSN